MRETFSLEDIFNVMIELESLGNKHYNQMQLMTEDLRLKELFGLLAKQEVAHMELYTEYKNKNIAFNATGTDDEYTSYMDALLAGTVRFLKDSSEFKDFDHGFEIAVNLEKDTILFLTELKRVIDPAYYDAMDAIADQERSHLKYLYEYKSK